MCKRTAWSWRHTGPTPQWGRSKCNADGSLEHATAGGTHGWHKPLQARCHGWEDPRAVEGSLGLGLLLPHTRPRGLASPQALSGTCPAEQPPLSARASPEPGRAAASWSARRTPEDDQEAQEHGQGTHRGQDAPDLDHTSLQQWVCGHFTTGLMAGVLQRSPELWGTPGPTLSTVGHCQSPFEWDSTAWGQAGEATLPL